MIGISAVSKNWIIGKDNKMPWMTQKEDFAHFRELTLGNSILVGRKTWEGMPKLKNRHVYILTRNNGNEMFCSSGLYPSSDNLTVHYLTKESNIPKDIFICGGAEIYKLLLMKCDSLHLTKFDFNADGDTSFPFSELELKWIFPHQKILKEIKDGKIWLYSKEKV